MCRAREAPTRTERARRPLAGAPGRPTGAGNGNRLCGREAPPLWRSPHQSPLTALRARAASSVRVVEAPITYNNQGHRLRVAVLVSAAPAPWRWLRSRRSRPWIRARGTCRLLQKRPLASLRQRMAEKRAEIDATITAARSGFATTTTPMMRKTPFLRNRRRRINRAAHEKCRIGRRLRRCFLKRNLELAIATNEEMQQGRVASNRAIETATAERNAARRDLARAERDVQRLAAQRMRATTRIGTGRLAARHASERRESLRGSAEHAQELNAQLAESQAARGPVAGDRCPCC